MTDTNDAVARVSHAMSHRAFANPNDIRVVLDRLEAAERDLSLLRNSWDAQQEAIQISSRHVKELAGFVDADVLESWSKRNGFPEGWNR